MFADRATGGALLVGSVPLRSNEEVFRTVADAIGDRLLRLPDGETGPRSDWIVWQYPVLSSRPEFEVCPPGEHPYRSLPRLRLRTGVDASAVKFEVLGYADAARSSYRMFSRLKRDGVIPAHCRFQVSLPTPLALIGAFITAGDQAAVEPVYESRLLEEVATILDEIPHDQLAIQWDTNSEFVMLEGYLPSWFDDVRAGVVERLLRLARSVPADVQLGFHLCHSHQGRFEYRPHDATKLVEVANALSSSLGRPLDWLHIPVPDDVVDVAFLERLGGLSLRAETDLYLGIAHLDDGVAGAQARVTAAKRYLPDFGVATECGWGRYRPDDVPRLLEIHRETTAPVVSSPVSSDFEWPEGFVRVQEEEWTEAPVDEFGLAYDNVEQHGWYRNLDPTVAELTTILKDGDILVDYSGGTGILLDRLKLRVFDIRVGTIIVDSSPKFLRVALEKFRDDPQVALRLLRFLRDERRLLRLDEVVGPEMLARGVDVIASTNAVHLYPDLAETVGSWVKVLRPGGRVLINSGNIRNPRAERSEWILDETVWVVADLAEGIVRTDPSYAAYRPLLDDAGRMAAHADHRDRVFLEPRRLDHYVQTFESCGLTVERITEQSIEAGVDDWFDFLSAYHDAVLGWVGGTERIDGDAPTETAKHDRLRLMRQAMDMLFGGRDTFQACWTYITCRKP
jgi:SAM-dependent methyltransferase